VEAVPDPVGTVRACAGLLRPDGLLVIQTPAFPEEAEFAQLQQRNDCFLSMMTGSVSEQHIYLFSRRAVRALLAPLGFTEVQFERALFGHDMQLIVSRQPLRPHTPAEAAAALLAYPSGRLGQALLDVQAQR